MTTGDWMRLKGKVAIVTGSGQGIGKAIALALAKEGATIVLSDITDRIHDVAKEVEALDSQAIAVKADISNTEQVEKMAKLALETFGRIDILVNNSGIYPFKSLADMSEQEWDRVLNVNLKGTFNCTKAVLPTMIKQKYGKIVNIASIAGTTVGYVGLTHYCASKAGIMGFTKAAALELAQFGINVNAIAPGPVETPGMEAALNGGTLEPIIQTIPIKRIGRPIDIANLVVFLASDESSNITGQCIVSDGGYTIQ